MPSSRRLARSPRAGEARRSAEVKERHGGAVKVWLVREVMAGRTGQGSQGLVCVERSVMVRQVCARLAPHSPTDQEVEETYQAVLGRIAGEGVLA